MSVFPRAVVLDTSKAHHYAVWVSHPNQCAYAVCCDCGDVVEVPLTHLEGLKRILGSDDEVQIIGWVEENG